MRGLRSLLVAIAAFAVMPLVLPVSAGAQQYPPTVSPTQTEKPPKGRPPTVISEQTERPGQLPFTGAQLTGIAALGLGAVGTGAVIVRRTRRRA